jgi:hypothetical protein
MSALRLLRVFILSGCGLATSLDFCSSPTSCLQAGFCDNVGHIETSSTQPEDQHERWELPLVNKTHLVIRWAPSHRLCSQTLDSYMVSLNSSSRVFNMVLSTFGQFPQNVCHPDSPARAQATLGDGRKGATPCGTYERRCSRTVTETLVEMFPYQWQAFGWAPNNLTVQASAYATLSSGYGGSRRVPLWCISFRKYDPRYGAGGTNSRGHGTGARWDVHVRRALARAADAIAKRFNRLVASLSAVDSRMVRTLKRFVAVNGGDPHAITSNVLR